ncbi:hypothetical protein A4A49_38185 [Nicotiana attenuata]|uniref:Uncharacterized protein n=1 Tax=Nicotiana attenuata TaxID=49451 RepID=A0A1J6ISX7_NICAT|nr:hypothetical protein A4A49_38185 [Nicotiana attenuata]
MTIPKNNPSTQKWQKAETKAGQKQSITVEDNKNMMDIRLTTANDVILPIAQLQKENNMVPNDYAHLHLINNSTPCLYPKDIDTTNIGVINSNHNSQSPLGNNSHKTSTPIACPLAPSSSLTVEKNKLQGMDIDPKIPTKSSIPSLMHNLGSPHITLPTLPMNEAKITQHIPSTNQTQTRSTSSHNTINAQDPSTPRKDKSLVPHVDPHSNITARSFSPSNNSKPKVSTNQTLKKKSLHDAKVTPQSEQKVQPDKEKRLDEASISTTTPNTNDLHHQANTTGSCPPILAGMGLNGTCTQHQSSTRREGSHNTNRGSLILGPNCDGRNATRFEQCDDTSMVESPAAHAHEYGSPSIPLELPCRLPTPHSPHAQSEPTNVPSPCKLSNPTPQLPFCPNPTTISTQHHYTHDPFAQDNTTHHSSSVEPNTHSNTTLNPPRIEPNPNNTYNPINSEPECDGKGGRRGRNSNRKNSGARSIKIPKNNGIPSKKRKKIHLKLPSGFEEMLYLYKEGESTEHLPTCSGASTNDVHSLLDTTGNDEERQQLLK